MLSQEQQFICEKAPVFFAEGLCHPTTCTLEIKMKLFSGKVPPWPTPVALLGGQSSPAEAGITFGKRSFKRSDSKGFVHLCCSCLASCLYLGISVRVASSEAKVLVFLLLAKD